METKNLGFYYEVLAGKYELPSPDMKLTEDETPDDDNDLDPYNDDSSVKLDDAVKFLLGGNFENSHVGKDANGSLTSTAQAETLAGENEIGEKADYFAVVKDGGRGKRQKKMSRRVRDIAENL